MSVMSQVGFAGVSIQTSFVRPGCVARRSASRSVMSTTSQPRPQSAAYCRTQRRSDQYMPCASTTWSPGRRPWKTAVAAAMPEANSIAPAPPSSTASSASAWM
jgi:hypothetical protein